MSGGSIRQMTQWNDEQKKVIDSRNVSSQILVSAAAGSGKTAVLVERILQSLLDKVDGEYVNDIDDFLVVTFTRAAAAQMKDKINREIGSFLDEESRKEYPDLAKIDHLVKQQIAVGRADICTLDSFSAKVVRENFNLIGIDPSFTTVDGNMMKLVKDDILDEMFEELFSGKDGKRVKAENFTLFARLFFNKTNDEDLKNVFYRITRVAETMPEPNVWLEESRIREGEDREKSFNSMKWVERLMDDIKGRVESVINNNETALKLTEKLLEQAEAEGDVSEAANIARQTKKLQEDRTILDGIRDAADREKGGSYRQFSEAFNNKNFKRNDKNDHEDITSLRKTYSVSDSELGDISKLVSANKKKKMPEIDSVLSDLFDNGAKWIDIMVDFSLDFLERVMAEKNRLRQYEFGDISHFALQILTEQEDGRIKRDEHGYAVPSKAAGALSGRYKYIYIDEYQDSSYIQEDMINSIARFKNDVPVNIFMVGDVKQSIYKFRQASPKLFVDKYNSFGKYKEPGSDGDGAGDAESSGNGMVIDLNTNYRSRSPVLDAVNRIFYDLMKKDIGGIDYDVHAALRYGAGAAGIYDPSGDVKAELTIITNPQDKEDKANAADDEYDNDHYEAALVADKINDILNDENYMVYSKEEGMRRVRPSDIVILSRSILRRADYYVDALARKSVSVSLDNSSGYFDAAETVTMLSMLRIIDNRRQDIPLTAVLNSPIGGLGNSDLMMIAGSGDYRTFYDACVGFVEMYAEGQKDGDDPDAQAGEGNKTGHKESGGESPEYSEKYMIIATKLKAFFNMVDELSEKQQYMSISMLIRKVMERTGYDIYVAALPSGQRRLANLSMLMQKADEFEKSSFSGLFNFLRYIDKCRIHDIDFAEAGDDTAGDDKVTIMSIHKSKGLEFPVVFLVGLGHEFNRNDEQEEIFVDGDNHIAVNYLDPKRRVHGKSFMMNAMIRLTLLGRVEEEQRLLYVGMTRARERLYMTGVDKRYYTKTGVLDYKTRSSLSTYLNWIEPVLSMDGGKNIEVKAVTFGDIKGVAREAHKDKLSNYNSFMMNLEEISRSKDIRERVDEISEMYDLGKNYKYRSDTETKAKISVTEIKKLLNEPADEDSERYRAADAYSEGTFVGGGIDQTNDSDGEVAGGGNDNGIVDDTENSIEAEKKAAERKEKEERGKVAARRGTLIHKIFELVDFKKVDSRENMKAEINRALQDPFFSDDDRLEIAQSRDIYLMSRFADTELFKEMKAADMRGQLYKEAEFTMGIPAHEIRNVGEIWSTGEAQVVGEMLGDNADNKTQGDHENKEVGDNSLVIVQGIIDGYYVDETGDVVIMDYKTDRGADGPELIRRHGRQLELYREAVEGIKGLKVSRTYIYSLDEGVVEVARY